MVPIPKPILEIACFNLESAVIAAKAGADRIELCEDYDLGGLSARTDVLMKLKSELTIPIPIYVMIRPHANHFCYDAVDFETMKETLGSLKSHGADGFVFGILNPDPEKKCDPTVSWIDVPRNKELVRLADGRPCTFHRAFDCIPESHWETALADIADCGFTSILTNGGPSGTRATDCIDQLQTLTWWKKAERKWHTPEAHKLPDIIVGGGVRSSNLVLLSGSTKATAFHSAALGSDGLACKTEVFNMKRILS